MMEKKIEELGGGYKQKVVSAIRDVIENAKLYHDLRHPGWIVSVEITPNAYQNLLEFMKQLVGDNICDSPEYIELRRGMWVTMKGSEASWCSVCKESVVHYKYDYCPHCGAKMGK